MRHPASEAVVYRMYDTAGSLLYVGMSINAIQRLIAHRSTQQWWPRVAHIDVKHFAGRKAAAAEESRAIKNEAPEFNVKPGHCVGVDIWPRRHTVTRIEEEAA